MKRFKCGSKLGYKNNVTLQLQAYELDYGFTTMATQLYTSAVKQPVHFLQFFGTLMISDLYFFMAS